MAECKNILCYGDSLTWGWVPAVEGVPTRRYAPNQRWTGVMAKALGEDYHVIEEGLSGRTTDLDDPNDARLNGAKHLPTILASHYPLDLVILMLGTNDSKSIFHRTPFDIAYSMSKLVGLVFASAGGVGTVYPAPKILVVAPPPLTKIPHPYLNDWFGGGEEKTAALAEKYQHMADFMKVEFFDAGKVVKTEGVDGVHFTTQNNADLGNALATKVREIF